MRLEFERLCFLVAEDNAYMRAALVAMLEAFGAQVIHQAQDGESALALFAEERPDVVLLDWEMPQRDGLSVARRMRDRETSPDPFVPILMISAHAERARVLEARDAGINDYLVKPVTPRVLYDKLLGLAVDQRPFVAAPGYFGPQRPGVPVPRATTPDTGADGSSEERS
ncbi:MAG: response regulator [Salinarimonas sp.]|nr:response regulator [Salinarimonas sp.]